MPSGPTNNNNEESQRGDQSANFDRPADFTVYHYGGHWPHADSSGFWPGYAQPRSVVVGTFAQILLMPLVAFAIAPLLGLAPALAVGLVIIAACPGGTTSNLFVLLARGHIALSILLTVSASLITIITLPFFTNYALQMYFGEAANISLPVGKTIAMLVVIVLLPVALVCSSDQGTGEGAESRGHG